MAIPTDATPDRSRRSLLVLLTAADGHREALARELHRHAVDRDAGVAPAVAVVTLADIPDDPFPPANPGGRPFDAVLDIEVPNDPERPTDPTDLAAAILAPLAGMVDRERSGAIVGWPQRVIPGRRAVLRYLYLMRRRPDIDQAQYLDHYFHRHAGFARHLHGTTAYTQLHADPDASAAAAARLGLGFGDAGSVTQLWFDTVEGFWAGVTPEAAAASADELLFVDRDRSVSFCCTEHVVRAGDDA